MKDLKIIAHRGASFYAPENTLASVKIAWLQNADAVEVDIHLSADKKIMVIHDKSTKRTTGVDYKIASSFSDKLRLLDAGSWKGEAFKGEKIPLLKEVLETIPTGKKLIIEIKSSKEIVPYLKEEVEKAGKVSQCEIISFDFGVLAEAKKALPGTPAFFLLSKLTSADLMELWKKLQKHNIDGLNLHFSIISQELAAFCKQNHIPLYSWTIDDAEVAKKLIGMGVVGITTNKPLEMREGLLK